jgi:hypothetical protein
VSPDEADYLLITGCPGCNYALSTEDLCCCDNETTGPLCPRCCALEHRAYKPWRTAA